MQFPYRRQEVEFEVGRGRNGHPQAVKVRLAEAR